MTQDLSRLSAALADRYTIERELGAGGMATVYLAHDIRHDRKVALKLMRPELAAVIGAERFLREIRTTANLQHPHILPLHDSGEVRPASYDGPSFVFYVMPYVEGESLRSRIERERQLPVDDAVRIACEVADALDYAHRHSVIHRDIKPENILLHDGRALVADFGIALAVSRSEGSTRMTETGMSLGTPHYMAPEQAMGERNVDARSDIYALGCVLYEMLAGEPPFTGPTAQSIIARVMTEEPRSLTLQRKSIPPHVEAVVRKALEKLPADRFGSAGQFAEALRKPGSAQLAPATTASGAAAATTLEGFRTRRIPSWPVSAAALLLAAGVGALGWALLRPGAATPVVPVSRFRLQLPANAAPGGALGSTIALSPDGSRMVYVGRGRDGSQLFTRSMSQLDPVPIAGTENAILPFFSPNGEWLGFRQGGKLVKVQIAGGPVLPIATIAGSVYGASWSQRDTIVFASDSGIMDVPASGGTARIVVRPDSARHELFQWPEVLPGDETVLFSVFSSGTSRLAAFRRESRELKRLAQPGGYPRYVDGGFVVLSGLGGNIVVLGFDPSRLEVSGSSVPFAEANSSDNGDVNLAVSRSGQVVYQPSGALTTARLVLADRNGAVHDLGAVPGSYAEPRVSPDGKRIAVGLSPASSFSASDIWVYDIERRLRTRLTTDTVSFSPLWTPDGRRIVYDQASGTFGNPGYAQRIYSLPADGGAVPQLVFGRRGFWTPKAFLPGARGLLINGAAAPDSNSGIWLAAPDSSIAPRNLTPGVGFKISPSLSPDARFFVYASSESGRLEVYVGSLSDPEVHRQVSSDGGRFPHWSRSGREIFFRAGNNGEKVMAVEVRTQPALQIGAATQLFEGQAGDFDLMPDGRSFLMLQTVDTQEAAYVVVLNWFDELRRKGGGKR